MRPKRNVSRTGTIESQYSIAVCSFKEAAVISATPRKVRRIAMKADASLGLSRDVMCGCVDS